MTKKQFVEVSRPFFESEQDAMFAFDSEQTSAMRRANLKGIGDYFVDPIAFERVVGTQFLRDVGKDYNPKNNAEEDFPDVERDEAYLSALDVEKRIAARQFFKPQTVSLRFTRGEGRIVNHIIALEKARLGDAASWQNAPPSLVNLGGKLQPDWFYQFLHGVHTLRTGLQVRMPSFWEAGPHSSFKKVYPAGRLSAVDPLKLPKGISGEPAPSSDAVTLAKLGDDSAELVEYYLSSSQAPRWGFQPQPILAAGETAQKLYEEGRKLVEAPESSGGMGCYNCHNIGKRAPAEPKYAPNLAFAKYRFKEDFVRRFLTNPQSIYPWANMPNNFNINWGDYDNTAEMHGVLPDAAKGEEVARKIRAVNYYLFHMGESDIGSK